MARTLLAVVLSGVLLGACGRDPEDSGAEDPRRVTWTFHAGAVGTPPTGFEVVEGDWRVRPDPEGGPNVLGQLAASPSSTFNLVLAEKVEAKDVTVSTRVYPVSGEIDRGGGLVWRAKDGKNYYVCRWNPLESNFRVYKVIDGTRIQLGHAEAPASGGWHELRAVMRGQEIQCFLDGERLLDVSDGDLPDAGRVGLWAKADAATLFSYLEVEVR